MRARGDGCCAAVVPWCTTIVYPCAVLVVHRLDAARRQCCRCASLFLSSGAQAAAARHEAKRARGDGCCAAVVPRYTTPVYYVLVYASYQPCSAVAVALRGAEAIRPSLPCCLCGLHVRCQLCCCAVGACCTSAVWAVGSSCHAGCSVAARASCSPCLLAFQTGGWVGLKLAGTRLSGDRRQHVHELRYKASPLVACLLRGNGFRYR